VSTRVRKRDGPTLTQDSYWSVNAGDVNAEDVNGGILVGAVGVEPTTNGLKGRCSTTELRP
jgi:hypothetical protein